MDLQRFEQLSAYLDGELSPCEKKQVEEWLDADPEFRKAYEDLRRLHFPTDAPVIDPELAERVMGRIDAGHRRRQVLGGSLAATTALALATGYWWQVPEVVAPVGDTVVAVQTLEVAARHYLIDEIPSEDPYAILLNREEPVQLMAR